MRTVRLIAENRYAAECESLTPIAGEIASIRTLRIWNAPVRVACVPNPVRGTRVKLRIVIVDSSIPARVVVKTVGLVPVAEQWVWLLPAARYAACLADDCPQ